MARPVTPREPSEYLTILSRVIRQIEISAITPLRKARITEHLIAAMGELQDVVAPKS
jgi:hypothetical protein